MTMDTKNVYLEHLYIYKDKFALPKAANDSVMQELEQMEVREDDIFIVTYPKSGTHWMQEIIHLILVNGEAGRLTVKERQIVIELTDHSSLDPKYADSIGPVLRKMKNAPSPRVLPTHVQYPLLPKQLRENEKGAKLIYIYRNPKDVTVSYYKFLLDLLKVDELKAKFEDFFDLFVSEQYLYGRWFEHVMEYYNHKDDKNFLPLSFEFLKQDLHKVVRDVASFIGKPLDDAVVQRVVEGASFETMKKSFQRDHEQNTAEGKEVIQASLFLRKGKTNQWMEMFTPEQNKRFDQVFRETMKDCEWTKNYVPDSIVE